jgi:hypothetical protein
MWAAHHALGSVSMWQRSAANNAACGPPSGNSPTQGETTNDRPPKSMNHPSETDFTVFKLQKVLLANGVCTIDYLLRK